MRSKKIIVSFLCFLLISFSAIGESKKGAELYPEKSESVKQFNSEAASSDQDHFFMVTGLLQLSVKLSEGNNYTFNNLKNNKNPFSYSVLLLAITLTGIITVLFSWNRQRNTSAPPLYIFYRSLII